MKKILEVASNIYQIALDRHESKIVNNILNIENFETITNPIPRQLKKIALVVPTLKRYAGGHTSILRLGTYLANQNIDVTYISFHNQDLREMREIARDNLALVKGEFLKYKDCKDYLFDVCIATSWESVYWTKQLNGYKVYFVQDYEPYFFKLNERYLLAKKTYELGFHIISLGQWNVKQIKRECTLSSQIDFVNFPYEPSEYGWHERDYSKYKDKKCIKLAVYTKEEGKRIPNLLQGILYKTKKELEYKGIILDISFFGLRSNSRVSIGKNLGKLSKDELINLYKDSDFGVVASMTNISLVPYEMMATGLPIIELAEGSFSEFLPTNSAILIDYNYLTLVSKLEEAISQPELIENMTKQGIEAISKLSWNKTGEEFLEILKSVVDSED